MQGKFLEQSMRKVWQQYLLLGIFTLQLLLVPFANAAIRTQIQAGQQDEDLLLICTGSEYRWISLSQTSQQGTFVFVDVDSDDESPDLQELPHCLWAWQNGHHVLKQVHQFDVPAIVVATHLGIKAPNAITSVTVEYYHSRAPPLTFVI
jgi:hypothetical protein